MSDVEAAARKSLAQKLLAAARELDCAAIGMRLTGQGALCECMEHAQAINTRLLAVLVAQGMCQASDEGDLGELVRKCGPSVPIDEAELVLVRWVIESCAGGVESSPAIPFDHLGQALLGRVNLDAASSRVSDWAARVVDEC